MRENQTNILIIGLGQIGLSNAEYMTELGLDVDGSDVDDKAVQRALSDGFIRRKAKNFRGYDYFVICISTHSPMDMFRPTMDGLYDVTRKISEEGEDGALVAIESTVTCGASNTVKELLGHRLHVCHFPHRYYSLEKEDHGVRQIRVLGGCESCCTKEAKKFYGDVLGIPMHLVNSIEYAELSKIAENSYRFLEIAFAEELRMFCDGYGLDFEVLRQAINTKWNVKVLNARSGIGGHCLPKDSHMYLDLADSVIDVSLLGTAKKIDERYRCHIGLGNEGVRSRRELYLVAREKAKAFDFQKAQQSEFQ